MNADQREEMRAIRAEQRALQARMLTLERRLMLFEQETVGVEIARPAVEAHVVPEFAPAAPPPLETPPPLPPIAREPRPPLAPPRPTELAQIATPPLPKVEVSSPAPSRESLEMQIGSTWLVRAGVVLVLTSLAFLGSYLYYHIVPMLGPAAKIALMYLGAGALTGAGASLERRSDAQKNEGLRNYARVVFAGGLAAVYYVTYAAHWNPHLLVLSNSTLAGALLLGWAAFMVWLADRRDSELLATFAILLAFYTSAVNEISSFTLVANLFLAGGAVYLLRWQLWKIFPFVSLLATFGSYGFWRFSHAYIEGTALLGDAPPRPALASGGFWVESGFLLLYWLLFTWAVFTADERVLPKWRRAGFVTVNNAAFFLLTTWLLLAAYPGTFWRLSLDFGVVLLALAETSRRLARPSDADTENAYLLQGVLLVTLGFIAYFSGWQLSLVLAVQSVVLLWLAGVRTSRLLLGSSCAVGGLSFLYALGHLHDLDTARVWIVGLAEGALLVANAWWSQRLVERSRQAAADDQPVVSAPFYEALTPAPSWFAFLGAAVWFWMLETPVTAEAGRAPLLAAAAVLLTASVYVLLVRALPWLAQGYLGFAFVHWLEAYGSWFGAHASPPVWNPLVVLGGALALGHWWQRREAAKGPRFGLALWDALLVVALLVFWLRPLTPRGDAGWTAAAALLSLAVLGYGALTRYFALAAAGQLLLVSSLAAFLNLWDHPWNGNGAERWLALVPLAATTAALGIGKRLVPVKLSQRQWASALSLVYEVAIVCLFLGWVERYVPRPVQFALLGLGGAVIFSLGCVYRQKHWILLSSALTVAGLFVFWIVESGAGHRGWLGLVGALIMAGQQQFGRRWLKEDAPAFFPAKAQAALMTAAVLCAWAFLTARMARWEGSAFTLAASWSLFAPIVFAAGLLLCERVYRWLGLLILAATLGHIVLFDISHLDSLGRAISSFVLGLVVLGIGFLYNRYHDKFRDLL